MDEQNQLPELSQIFKDFLACVDKTGARAAIWDEEKKEETYWNVPTGCIDHKITDTNLVTFRPLTRRERREFHISKQSNKIRSLFVSQQKEKAEQEKQS